MYYFGSPDFLTELILAHHPVTIFYVITSLLLAIIVFLLWLLRKHYTSSQHDELEIERTINYFATSLFGKNTVEEILWDVTKNCISHLNFEDCVIYLVEEDRQVLIQKAAYGPKNPNDYIILEPIEVAIGRGIVGSVAATGVAEVIADTSEDSRYIVDDDLRYSEIAVPIIYQGKVLGVIDSEHHQKDFFQPKHLFILTTIASLCANKIMRYQVEEAYRLSESRLHDNSRQIAATRLAALRLQMKPRIVFHSLQSIDNCILNNNPAQASAYLNKCSEALQMLFENAQQEWISLDQEMKGLMLYLEQEQMRCNSDFRYTIGISPEIHPASLQVPPLMLYPFVENALLHGLRQKEGAGNQLDIRYWLDQHHKLCMSVEDNGIGRAAAAEFKADQVSTLPHQGLTLTEERVQLINTIYGAHIQVEIKDLIDDSGEPAGTRVIISLDLRKA